LQQSAHFRERLEGFDRAAVQPMWAGLAQSIDLRSADGGRDTAYRAPTQRANAWSVERLHCVVASYSGHLRHGAAMQEWVRAWAAYPWLGALFVREGWAVQQRWAPCRVRRARRFQEQYWQLTRGAEENCLVFCQVGRFIEFYGGQRLVAARSLGLRTVYAPRAAYAFTVGFPVGLSAVYKSRALRAGLGVLDVRQSDSLGVQRCRPRRPVQLLIPARPLRAS
jgi:hypothetical protein